VPGRIRTRNPQQASGRRPTPQTTRPPGPAQIELLGEKQFSGFNFAASETKINVFTRVSLYLTGNTLRSHYKDKSVNAVVKISNYRASHKEYIHTLCGGKCEIYWCQTIHQVVESRWNVMAHGDAREGKWRGNWRTGWVASILHTTSEHGVSIITTDDAHTSAASSRMNWRPLPIEMDSSVSPKDEIWFLNVCNHISAGLYMDIPLCINRLWRTTRDLPCMHYYKFARCKSPVSFVGGTEW